MIGHRLAVGVQAFVLVGMHLQRLSIHVMLLVIEMLVMLLLLVLLMLLMLQLILLLLILLLLLVYLMLVDLGRCHISIMLLMVLSICSVHGNE